ncbi:MAG: winged helix-turn-helix domain-containing protein [Sedimenticolaceae bacterium]
MLDSLFTSKMRVQILMRLFLNASSHAYLRELANEFDASPGHLRSELQQLRAAGLLRSEKDGREVHYRADSTHPLFPELQSMVRKAFGMDRIIESIVSRLGELEAAYLTGDYAKGRDTGVIDLLLVGEIDRHNLSDLVSKTERYIGRKIRTLVLSSGEFDSMAHGGALEPRLELWRDGA